MDILVDSLKSNLPIKNYDLLEKYLSPYIWEGEFFVDGGWGDKAKVMSVLDTDLFKGLRLPFVVMPINDLDESGRDSNRRYKITFAGEQFKILFHYHDVLKKLGIDNQLFILKSYLTDNEPAEGEAIYELTLHHLKDSNTTIKIERAKWVPDFSQNTPCVGFNF